MKKISLLFALCSLLIGYGAHAAFSCGDGYILVSQNKIDGINSAECQKLWCRDLETGKPMGAGKTAAVGYRDTASPVELCDAQNNCVYCFGERKWCKGEETGIWNPEYGAYTKSGADSVTYISALKSGCFKWNLGSIECARGEAAVLRNGTLVCAIAKSDVEPAAVKKSSVRRTSATGRIKR